MTLPHGTDLLFIVCVKSLGYVALVAAFTLLAIEAELLSRPVALPYFWPPLLIGAGSVILGDTIFDYAFGKTKKG